MHAVVEAPACEPGGTQLAVELTRHDASVDVARSQEYRVERLSLVPPEFALSPHQTAPRGRSNQTKPHSAHREGGDGDEHTQKDAHRPRNSGRGLIGS